MSAHSAQLSFSVENLLGLGNKERGPNHSLQEHALQQFFEEEKRGHQDIRKEDNSYQNRRRRILFSESQVDILKSVFAKQKYLTAECRKRLAESLNLSPKQVKTWFQNYRYKCRRKGFGSKGCAQAELEQEMQNGHVGTATMVAPTWTNISPPDVATVFCRNFHPSWEHTSSMAPLNTLYGNQEYSLANFSYRFPSKYQHLQAYQMYAN